jgi:transcriptional regulator with XRE-family HTH domain
MSFHEREEAVGQQGRAPKTKRRAVSNGKGASALPRAPIELLATAIQDCYSAENLRGPSARRRAIERVMQAYYADQRITRIIVTLCYEHKMQEHRDEIRQRAAIMFYERFLPLMIDRRNPSDDPYKYLYAITYNVLRTVRSQLRAHDVSLDAAEVDRDEPVAAHHELAVSGQLESVDEEIDREVAVRQWIARAETETQESGFLRPVVAKVFTPPPGGEVRLSSKRIQQKAGEKLRSIRDDMNLRTEDLAQMIGATPSALSSYMYGRVTEIPPQVARRAAAIYADFCGRLDTRSQYLSSASMPEIVQEWMLRLTESQDSGGAEPDAERKLMRQIADLLEVHYTTVWRWRQTPKADGPLPMRPSLRKLRLYDDRLVAASAVAAARKASELKPQE